MAPVLSRPAVPAGAPVTPRQLPFPSIENEHASKKLRSVINGLLFYGLVLFGVGFPIVGTIIGVIAYR